MSDVNVQLTGRLTRPTSGPGVKIIQGVVTIGGASEALHASDFGLMKFHTITVQPPAPGTLINVVLDSPGSANNFASFTASTIPASGSAADYSIIVRTAGSDTLFISATGE